MKKTVLTFAALLAFAGTAQAADLAVPHTFSPGTPIKSSDVNANFSTIFNTLNATNNKLGSVSSFGLDSGLVAYFPFNGNAYDASGNGNNATVAGATLTTDRFGVSNSAYSFDGSSSCIKIPASSSLNSNKSVTLTAWIKKMGLTNNGTSDSTAGIIGQWATPDNGLYVLAYGTPYNSSNMGAAMEVGLNTSTGATTDAGVAIFNDNIWKFIVGRYDYTSGVLSLSVDGSVVNSKNVGQTNYGLSSTQFTIGCYQHLSSSSFRGFFNGSIDEVRVYNRVLDDNEVNTLYARR